MKEPHFRTGFFLTLLILVTILVVMIFQPYLITLSIAGTLAVILYPLYEWVLPRVKGNRSIAAVLMVLLSFVLVLLPLSFLGIQIAAEARSVYIDLSTGTQTLPLDLLQRFEALVQTYAPGTDLNLDQYAGQALQWLTGALQTIFAGTINTLFMVLLGAIALYYMFKDGKRFVEAVVVLSPLTEAEDWKIADKMRMAVNSVIRGSLIIAVLQGIVTGIGLAIFGIPSAVLLGSIAAVGALIPTVGTTIVLAPLVIYLLVIGSYGSALGLTLWGAIAVGLLDNFLHPILVGRGIKMHPIFIFFSVIGGIAYFGLAGFILGPLVMTLFFALLDIFRSEQKLPA